MKAKLALALDKVESWSRHLPVATKLTLRMVLILALLGITAMVGIFTGASQTARSAAVATVEVPLLRTAADIKIRAHEATGALLIYLDTGDSVAFARQRLHRAAMVELVAQYRSATESVSRANQRRLDSLVAEFDSRAADALAASQRQRRLLEELSATSSRLLQLLPAGDQAGAAAAGVAAREALLRHAAGTWEFLATEDPAVRSRIQSEGDRYRDAAAAYMAGSAPASVQRDAVRLGNTYFSLTREILELQTVKRSHLRDIGRIRRSLNERLDQTVQAPARRRLETFVADTERVRRAQIVLTVGVLLVALALAALAAERLTHEINAPLTELVSVSNKMTVGDLNQRVKVDASREFNVLANAFNRMAESLGESEKRRNRALEQARAASDAKSRFVADVSHEMRTPLTSLRGSLILLANKAVDPASRKGHTLLQVAVGSTDRLIRMINDRLDLDKIEAEKGGTEHVPVDLATVISDGVRDVSMLAAEKNIALEVYGDAPPVSGDRDALVQVVVNIVGNAIKFSPPRSTVSVTTSSDGDYARVAVSDEGPGIAERDRVRIFRRFEQVSEADASIGTGLGLAIARGIVEEHRGAIGVESNPGQGATFWFTVPFAGVDG